MRYAGFPEFIMVLVKMGFLTEEEADYWKSPIAWKEATQKLLGASSSSESDLVAAIDAKANFKSPEERERILAGMRWIGIFSDEKTTPRKNPLDTLCAALEAKMQYAEGERDMVL